MNKFLNFLKSERGSAEILGLIFVLPFLLLPIFNTVYSFVDMNKYDIIKQVSRDALLRMEIEGGLTQDGYYGIMSYLESKGFNVNNVHVDYTPAPVQYGDEVDIKITYNYVSRRFTFGMGGIKRVDQNTQMSYGPLSSISKKYSQ